MAVLLLVLGATAVVVAWGVAWPAARLWLALLKRMPAGRALRAARWSPALLVAPIVAGTLVALGAIGLVEHGLACHCAPGSGLHLCPVHPGNATPLLPLALGVWLLIVPRFVGGARRGLRGWWRGRSAERRLSGVREDGGVRLLELGRRNAFTFGVLRPKVVADATWWASLRPAERALVAAHEGAHVRRGDPLMLAIVRGLASVLPPVTDAVVAWWQAGAEHDADRHAARACDRDPLDLAEFLLRELRTAPAPLGFAFAGTATERRIAALTECTLPAGDADGDLDRTVSTALLSGLFGVLLGGEIHLCVERILAWLS